MLLILFACIMLGLGLYLGGFRQTETRPQESMVAAPEVVQPPQAPSSVPQSQIPLEPPPQLEMSEPSPAVSYEPPAPPPPQPARPLSEMPGGFVANLPPLNIDIHSYDQRPAKRYVLINLEKYHEGDYLAEGPQLIEILTDGVILEHLGERFILPIGNQ
jgi:general secretion pathway protein B